MLKRILVPVDLDAESTLRPTFEFAQRLAEDHGAELHVLTIVPTMGMSIVGGFFPADFEKRAMAAAGQKLAAFVDQTAHAPSQVGRHVGHGTIYEEIIKAADALACDMIVMASHRPELKDYLLGPNAARVARHAKQSVVIVRDI